MSEQGVRESEGAVGVGGRRAETEWRSKTRRRWSRKKKVELEKDEEQEE